MNKADYESLQRGIAEVGLMMKGELPPAREFVLDPPAILSQEPPTVWAVCVSDEDDALMPGKIYEGHLGPDGNYISVTDDAGEAFGCPAEWFILVKLPQEVTTALKKVA